MSATCLPSVSIALLLGLSACTVYTPIQPHAPLIRARGEGEISGHVEASLRPEIQAAYSPVSHFLLLASGTWRPGFPIGQEENPYYFRTSQYEVGAGTYWTLGPRWVATATAGFGAAQVQRRLSEFGILLAFSNDYEAKYRKNYGQLGLAYQAEYAAVSFGYRLVQVKYTALTSTDVGTSNTVYQLPLDEQFRHEPYVLVRYSLGSPLAQSRWQFQLGSALSFCIPGRTGNGGNPFDPVAFRAQFNQGNMLLLNAGVVYCLKKRPATEAAK